MPLAARCAVPGQPLMVSSTTWVTRSGASDIGECPQPLSETCRAPGSGRAALSAWWGGVTRSRVPQSTVTGTENHRGEGPQLVGAHSAPRRLEAGRADQVAQRAGGRHLRDPPGPGGELPESHGAPDRVSGDPVGAFSAGSCHRVGDAERTESVGGPLPSRRDTSYRSGISASRGDGPGRAPVHGSTRRWSVTHSPPARVPGAAARTRHDPEGNPQDCAVSVRFGRRPGAGMPGLGVSENPCLESCGMEARCCGHRCAECWASRCRSCKGRSEGPGSRACGARGRGRRRRDQRAGHRIRRVPRRCQHDGAGAAGRRRRPAAAGTRLRRLAAGCRSEPADPAAATSRTHRQRTPATDPGAAPPPPTSYQDDAHYPMSPDVTKHDQAARSVLRPRTAQASAVSATEPSACRGTLALSASRTRSRSAGAREAR